MFHQFNSLDCSVPAKMLFEFSFLLTLVMANHLVATHFQNSNDTLPKPHVIIVGQTGAGKSSLANALIGEDPTCEDCLFPVCHDMDSCTKNTHYCGNSTWLGIEEASCLCTFLNLS